MYESATYSKHLQSKPLEEAISWNTNTCTSDNLLLIKNPKLHA